MFTNCKGDDDVDAKRSRPSIGKPAMCHARKERAVVIGTDQRITSGPAARTAASRGRIHGCTRIVSRKVRFFSLAPRAASIHGTARKRSGRPNKFCLLRCCGLDVLAVILSLDGRVGMWRGGCRLNISVAASFVWRCLSGSAVAPFPHSAHRTGQADFPHPALGQDFHAFTHGTSCPSRHRRTSPKCP